MATIYTEQAKNVRKTWFFMGFFFVLIVALGWIFSYVYNEPVILYVGVVLSILLNFGSYWFSDKIALSINRARLIEKSDHQILWNVVENLSITAGLPMPRLYIIEDASPNAFATGRDKNHAAVAVTTGLLAMMNRSELEGVIAHELSHIGNRDILISTIVVVLAGFVTILSDTFLRLGRFRRRDDRGSQIGLVIMIAGIVLAVLSPIIATLIRLAISRKREFLADASGVLMTRYPEGLASALEKLRAYSGRMQVANNATAHLFITNPFGSRPEDKEKIGFLQRIFMTHPPLEERIKILRSRG